MKVAELMSSEVVTIGPENTVFEAAELIRTKHVGSLVVCAQTEQGREPVGILTDRDIVVGALAQNVTDLKHVRVEDLMARDLYTADADAEAHTLISLMVGYKVRRVPVINAFGCLEGIVCLDDVVRGYIEQLSTLTRLPRAQRSYEAYARVTPRD